MINELLTIVFNTLLSTWYIWVTILAFSVAMHFVPQIKGGLGEKKVRRILSRLPEEKYFPLHDIMLATETGTTQIDHIVVSVYGIFVIETKTYTGWIYGGEKDEYWIQNIYGKKSRFKNPLRQNYGHIKALETLLCSFQDVPLISVAVFSNQCDLKISAGLTNVIYFSKLKKYVKQFDMEILSEETAQQIFNLIASNNINDRKMRKKHIKAVREKVNSTNEKIDRNICPKCGGELILRKGKYGNFTGCQNYPKCRFTIKE